MFCRCPPQKTKAKAPSRRGCHRRGRSRALCSVGNGYDARHRAVGGRSWNACAKHMASSTSALQSGWGSAASNYLLSEQIKTNYSIINSARGSHESSWEDRMLWFLFHRPSGCPARERLHLLPLFSLPCHPPFPPASPCHFSPLSSSLPSVHPFH